MRRECALPTKSRTNHRRHNEDHRKAQKAKFCAFSASLLCLLCTFPDLLGKAAELLPQIQNSKRISVGRDRCQQHLSWVKCDPDGWISPGQLLVVIVECAGQSAAFDLPNLQALRITGSE